MVFFGLKVLIVLLLLVLFLWMLLLLVMRMRMEVVVIIVRRFCLAGGSERTQGLWMTDGTQGIHDSTVMRFVVLHHRVT